MNIFPFLASNAEAVGAPAISWDAPGIIFLKLLAVVSLVLLNGFFVASEFAIVKVRSSQLDALAARGNGHARLARHVTSHLDAYLSATQLGITLASLGLGWLGEPFLARMIEPFFALANITSPALIETVAFALAFAAITILHIVLGELAPKSLAIRKPVPTTLWISPPLRIFYVVFKPAIWLLNGLASSLLRRIFHLDPVAEGELAHSEEELRLILEFGLERREFQRLGEDEFRVDGGLGIYEMRDLAGLEWKDEDVTTVGGYVVHRLGHLPRVGEQVHLDDYIVTVEQADGRRVQELRFQRVAKRDSRER